MEFQGYCTIEADSVSLRRSERSDVSRSMVLQWRFRRSRAVGLSGTRLKGQRHVKKRPFHARNALKRSSKALFWS